MRSTIKMAATGGVAILLAVAATPARAEIEVLESSAPGIAARAKLPDDTQLKLPKDTEVRVLMRTPSGTITKTIKGPYKGTAAEYKEKRSWWDRLVRPSKDNNPPPAAVRSAPPLNPPQGKPDNK